MKLENLKVGAIIMHADAKTNPVHAGTMYIVLKIDEEREDIEACCVNCQRGTAIGEVRHISTSSISEYNMLFQIGIESPTPLSNDLWLRWTIGKKTSLGKVGDQTPYRLGDSRCLFVGDVVTVKNDEMEGKSCLVVHDEDDGYYVMGIASDCNSKTGEIKNFTVSLEKSFSVINNGDTFATAWFPNGIEAVDFAPKDEEND